VMVVGGQQDGLGWKTVWWLYGSGGNVNVHACV
jgi:hypothetical protein